MDGSVRPMSRELESERMRLRPWSLSDAAAVRALWSERDPRSRRILSADGHPTVPEMRVRISEQLKDSERSGLALLAIKYASEPGFLGYCGLTIGEGTTAEPELAFELVRSAQGRGIATEAGYAVVEAARQSGHARLWATVREWNAPSFRVLDKLGFVHTGRIDPDAVRGGLVWLSLDLAAR